MPALSLDALPGRQGPRSLVLALAVLLPLAGCFGGKDRHDLARVSREPVIWSFAPTRATAYSRVDLSGSGFTGATRVCFAGVPAARIVVPDDHTLYAAVPPDALSGLITVTTPVGVAESMVAFEFDPAPSEPRVSDLLPKAGPVGTKVTLRGSGLFSVQSITFGGVPAPFPPSVSDSELVVAVPPGAHSGAITVTLPNGATASSRTFQVTGRPLQAPVITRFSPVSGGPGTSLEVDGTHFSTVDRVAIGAETALFRVWNDTRLQVWVPASAPASGHLTVTSPSGTGTHPTPFTLVEVRPVIRDFFPQAGKAGTEVTIEGEHLLRTRAVRFGGVHAPGVQVLSDQELRVTVPPGAVTGPITLEAARGHGVSARAFRVTEAEPGLQARIKAVYVTQATQRLDGSVPLVANRNGMLRVFLLGNRPNTLVPGVEVKLLDARHQVLLAAETFATGAGLPTRLDEDNLAGSWNLNLPGPLLQPGVSLQVRVLPLPGLDLPPEGLAWPEDGTSRPLHVVKVPPIGITLIPIAARTGTGRVTDRYRALASWAETLRGVYPLDQVDLEVGAPHYTSLDLDDEGDGAVWPRLRDELEVERLNNPRQSGRYHYGVYARPTRCRLLGLGHVPPSPESNRNRTAIGCDQEGHRSGDNYGEIFAHELGHCLNRRHSPCGGAKGADFNYPHPGGVIGASGLDLRRNQALNGRFYTDVMAYCSPVWVSDYTYEGVLDWLLRQAKAAGKGAHALTEPRPGLVIWGQLRHGAATLEPVFGTPDCGTPPEPGDCALKALDDAGHVLFETSFAPEAEPDLPEGADPGRSFLFVIPDTPALQSRLAELQVLRAGAILGTLRATVSGSAPPRDPVATVWGEGQVLLTWDAAAHPRVIIRDAATGESLGMAEGGTATLPTSAASLDLTLSNNLHTLPRHITVRP